MQISRTYVTLFCIKFLLISSSTDKPVNVEMYKVILNLKPFAVYSFFVETYVLDGEVRKSGAITMRLSQAGEFLNVFVYSITKRADKAQMVRKDGLAMSTGK